MRMMRCFLVTFILAATVSSCNSDRKKETITNYLHYVWKIGAPGELIITRIEEINSITGKDSLDILLVEYSKGAASVLPLDTILINIEKDLAYNSNLLNKTKRRIDSLNSIKKTMPDNPFYADYIKTFVDLRDFTATQLVELKFQKYLLTRYHEDEDKIFSHQVVCQYKVKGHSSDTSSRVVMQTFFLSPDTRKIYRVK